MGLREKFKAIISELTIKPEVPEDRVKRLTEEDQNTLSECIKNLIWTEEYKNKNLTAVYVTAYWINGKVQIYVNFLDTMYSQDDYISIPCKVKGIRIDKVMRSSAGFGYWDENKKEMPKKARELFECIYYKAYYNLEGRPNQREKSKAYAKKIGAKPSESKVTFEPPLNLTK